MGGDGERPPPPLARSYNNLKPPPQLRSLHDRGVAALRSGWADTDRLINEVSSSGEPRKILERERRREEPIFRELLDVYTALEVRDCVLLTAATADYGGGRSESRVADAGACREIKETGRQLRGDVRSAATEVRAERRTVEGLEGEVRTYPEDRAEIEPDLNSSQRTLKDDRRELTTARRELRSLEADARREGCALATEPAPVDAAACHEIAESSRELRKDVRGAAEEARAEQTTIDELERDIRSYPEERAETEPDLRDSQRALKDIQGELARAQRGLKSAQADARSERCSR